MLMCLLVALMFSCCEQPSEKHTKVGEFKVVYVKKTGKKKRYAIQINDKLRTTIKTRRANHYEVGDIVRLTYDSVVYSNNRYVLHYRKP